MSRIVKVQQQVTLQQAAAKGDVEEVVRQIKSGKNVNEVESFNGYSALHWAADSGHLNVVQALLKYGANKNMRNANGDTPLHIAAMFGHEDVVCHLLAQGALVNIKNHANQTASEVAKQEKKLKIHKILLSYDTQQLLFQAAAKGDCAEMKKLLTDPTVWINGKEPFSGYTALHWAVDRGQLEAVKLLTELGAQVNARTNQGDTPLHVACLFNHVEVARFLLLNGADVTRNSSNHSPSDIAKHENYSELFTMLSTQRSLRDYQETLALLRKTISNKITQEECSTKALLVEITETFEKILVELIQSTFALLSTPPCSFAIFIGGSLARYEATLYSDIDFGILVERKDKKILDFFSAFSHGLANKIHALGENDPNGKLGFRYDNNFSPPHIRIVRKPSFRQDSRGLGIANQEENVCEKKGNLKLIDTPKNLAGWLGNGKEVGASVLASILGESRFLFGTEEIFDQFRQHVNTNMARSRKELCRQTAASLKKNITNKLPTTHDVKNALYMNDFELVYDLKDNFGRMLYLMVSAEYIAQATFNEFVLNSFDRIERLQPPKGRDAEQYKNFKESLLRYYDFIIRLRVSVQAHYGQEYEKVLGRQVLQSLYKQFKQAFLDIPRESNGSSTNGKKMFHRELSRKNIEYYSKSFLEIKSHLLLEETLPSEQEKILHKVEKLWQYLFNDSVPEGIQLNRALFAIERKLEDLLEKHDNQRYFIVTDSVDGVSELKTQLLTKKQILQLKQQLQTLQSDNTQPGLCKEICNQLYGKDSPLHSFSVSFLLNEIETDLHQLELGIHKTKGPIQIDPFILNATQIQTLSEIIDFIRNSIKYFT